MKAKPLGWLAVVSLLVGCGDGQDSRMGEPQREGSRPDHGTNDETAAAPRSPTLASCENVSPAKSWKRDATSVRTETQSFGLLVRKLGQQSYGFRNGNSGVKAGAVLEGRGPVTLRVPRAERQEVGLVYGRVAVARAPAEAAGSITFRPCPGRQRSGWVGGLVFEGEIEAVALQVEFADGVRVLRLRP